MVMKRRGFLMALFAGVAAATFGRRARVLPDRYTEAVRARFYPGHLARLDKEQIPRPGRWAG